MLGPAGGGRPRLRASERAPWAPIPEAPIGRRRDTARTRLGPSRRCTPRRRWLACSRPASGWYPVTESGDGTPRAGYSAHGCSGILLNAPEVAESWPFATWGRHPVWSQLDAFLSSRQPTPTGALRPRVLIAEAEPSSVRRSAHANRGSMISCERCAAPRFETPRFDALSSLRKSRADHRPGRSSRCGRTRGLRRP